MLKAISVVVLAISLLAGTLAHGRTWRVERDGSGDFTVIQDAVDAAGSGDVIEIGPGRFDEFAQYDNGGPTWDIYIFIVGKDLTFIGAGMGRRSSVRDRWRPHPSSSRISCYGDYYNFP